MIIISAMVDTHLSSCVGLLEAGPKRTFPDGQTGWLVPQRAHHVTNIGERIKNLRKLSARRKDAHLDKLVREFRWAMTKVQKSRNFLAHGMLAGDTGSFIFWSQRKLKHMSLEEIVESAPTFKFAWRVIELIRWRLLGIEPPYALPDRPV